MAETTAEAQVEKVAGDIVLLSESKEAELTTAPTTATLSKVTEPSNEELKVLKLPKKDHLALPKTTEPEDKLPQLNASESPIKVKLAPPKEAEEKTEDKSPELKASKLPMKDKLSPPKEAEEKIEDKLPELKASKLPMKDKLSPPKETEQKTEDKLPELKASKLPMKDKLAPPKEAEEKTEDKLPPLKASELPIKDKLAQSESVLPKENQLPLPKEEKSPMNNLPEVIKPGLPTEAVPEITATEPQKNVESDKIAIIKAGHGAQVLKVLEDHTYELDIPEIENVLLKKEVRDLPVVVVSVAGAYRLGKSFLLNFFLRYLTSPLPARQDGSWLGEDSEKLSGFSWRGGSVRNTTGILMWSEPVVMTLPSNEKVAIILMDTQGTFDNESTVRDCSTIFGFSTLLSSVQIYNLSGNIKEDDMQHLQLFTDYGKLARSESSTKPFQVLEFLVRDWPYYWEFDYGAEGGQGLLQKKLIITKTTPKEIKTLREQLHSSFEIISAFLLPHPGFKVMDPNFKGEIKDLEPLFRINLIKLVESLFSPDKLMIKMINGEKIKARDLYTYIKTYMTLFNSADLPLPENIMQATITASLLSSKDEAREVYTKGMDAECGPEQPSMPAADLQELHRKYMASARTIFLGRKKMGSFKEANKYLEELIKELDEHFPQFEQNNNGKFQMTIKKAKEAYENTINNASKGNQLCLHPLDLQQLHEKGVEVAIVTFDANRKLISSTKDEDRLQFEHAFKKVYEKLQLTNELNNKTTMSEIRSKYSTFMETKCSLEPPLCEKDFKREHDGAIKIALTEFDSKRNQPHSYPEDVFREQLIKDITLMFEHLNKMNIGKYKAVTEAVMKHATNEARQLYEKQMQLECGLMQPSMPDSDLETLHSKYLNLAKEKFSANVTIGTEDEADKNLQDVVKELEGRLPQYQQNNRSKYQTTVKNAGEEYEKIINEVTGGQSLILHPLDLLKVHQKALEAAMKFFDDNRKKYTVQPDDKRAELEKSFENRYKALQQTNEINNKTASTESLAVYSKFMEMKYALEPPLAEDDFKREHETAVKSAIEKFGSMRNQPNSYPEDVHKQDLISDITAKFNQLNEMNKSKYKAVADAILRQAINKARQEYEKGMQSECGSLELTMPTDDVETLHRKYLEKAKETFIANLTMTALEDATGFIQELCEEAEERLMQYKQNNISKYQTMVKTAEDAYEEIIRSISHDQLLCLHPTDLEKGHQLGVTAAMKVFAENRKIVSSKIDNDKLLFEKSFEKRFYKLKLLNEQNNQTIIKETHTEYWKAMETKASHIPPLSDESFLSEHNSALKVALDDFDFRRNLPNEYDVDVYRDELIKKIMNAFAFIKLNNTTKRLEYEEIKKEQGRNRTEQEKLQKEQERNKREQEMLKAGQEKFEAEQAKIRQKQEKRAAEYEQMIRDERERDKTEREEREKQETAREEQRMKREQEERAQLLKTFQVTLDAQRKNSEQQKNSLLEQQKLYQEHMKHQNEQLLAHTRELQNIIAQQHAESRKPRCVIV